MEGKNQKAKSLGWENKRPKNRAKKWHIKQGLTLKETESIHTYLNEF